jgi:hypothetical protein
MVKYATEELTECSGLLRTVNLSSTPGAIISWPITEARGNSLDPYKLSPSERRTIQHSIQQFQLGEGSEGRRLLDRGRADSRAAGDPHFAEALSLFVKEEQRHSAHLLQFMRGQEIPRISAHG